MDSFVTLQNRYSLEHLRTNAPNFGNQKCNVLEVLNNTFLCMLPLQDRSIFLLLVDFTFPYLLFLIFR